ncbi:hypothetical protein [Actinomadura sp. SCN-SB]|uniref:hypothetical protein n=1 Tax=Actinomadura sp. SCN-SB TaxID=3373092 RepID=UPI003750522A
MEERRALIRLAIREVRVFKAPRSGAPWDAEKRVEITWADGSVTRPPNAGPKK